MFNLTPAIQEEHDSLIEKCQENGWLKRGGFDWQDDPWLEEHPYDFSRASTMKDLAGFFSNGNRAIRQGVLFGDLAFIQQVDGGDEWWTLKRCPADVPPTPASTPMPIFAYSRMASEKSSRSSGSENSLPVIFLILSIL